MRPAGSPLLGGERGTCHYLARGHRGSCARRAGGVSTRQGSGLSHRQPKAMARDSRGETMKYSWTAPRATMLATVLARQISAARA